jgi:predicted kinase
MNKLLIICGISFAGKSTLAAAICDRFGYVEVDVDEVKTELYGPGLRDDELSQSDWERIYAEADKLIAAHLQSGKTVVDASRNFTRHERQAARRVARSLNVDTVTILVATPEAIARQRLLENRLSTSRRDVTDDAFDEILKVWEPPADDEPALVFHYGDDMARWLSTHGESLR